MLEAAPFCQAAFSTPIRGGRRTAGTLSLLTRLYEESPWQPYSLLTDARFMEEIKTLVCIQESRNKVGIYNDGEVAYQRVWEVRLVEWPSGIVVAARDFTSAPPDVKFGSGPGYGVEPVQELLGWLVTTLGDRTILLHQNSIGSVAFMPDGRTLVAAVSDAPERMGGLNYPGVMQIWNVETGQKTRSFIGHDAVAGSVAVSPQGDLVASGDWNGVVIVWDMTTGRPQHSFTTGEDGLAHDLAFSPDGAILAAIQSGRIWLWQLSDGAALSTPVKQGIKALAFSSSDQALNFVTEEGIGTWNWTTAQSQFKPLNLNRIDTAVFSADGQLLAIKNVTGIVVWNVADGQQISRLLSQDWGGQMFPPMAFSPDGRLLAVGDIDGQIAVWDFTSGQAPVSLGQQTIDMMNSLAFSQDGTLLAGAWTVIKIWTLDSKTPTPTPMPTPSPDAIIVAATVNVYEGPGTEYPVVGQLNKAEELSVLGQFKNCSWLKVINQNEVTGWISGEHRYVELHPSCSDVLVGTFHPLTGIVKPNTREGGYGELSVSNGTPSDGIVILTLDDQPVTAVYIRSGESYTMKGIRDGIYYLYFSTGSEWDGERFTLYPSYKRFEDAFEFTTTSTAYTIWSVTLHGVLGGTASAEEVNASEFPDIGD